MKKKRVMIIDALNQFLRSYIVDPSLSTNGLPIGGVKGFFKILQKLNREIRPDYIVIAWDGAGGSQKRKTMHKEYKAGRKPIKLNRNLELNDEEEKDNKMWQLNRLVEYLNLTPVVQIIEDGVEADDFVSLVTKMPRFDGWIKVIVSSDKDFYQLCDDETILYRPIQKEVLNKNTLVKKFGIHPKNFALARALVGDASDNLPGVKGVGLPTVAKRFPFLAEDKRYEIRDVEEACEKVDSNLKIYSNILDGIDAVKFNLKMMQLDSPSVSFQTRQRVDWTFDNAFLSFNQTDFVMNSIKDGFGEVQLRELFAAFKRIARESKTSK